jgi:membrane-bound metal-dependent hydrolase YbcI (DUF457 family)
MMRKTHRAFAGAFWLGSSLVVDATAVRLGHPAPFTPVVVIAGLFIAPVFSAGKPTLDKRFGVSPDIDHIWAPGPPRKNYDWKGHRGFTHRIWFAFLVSLLTGILPFLALIRSGTPAAMAVTVFAVPNGWWSHLVGDMIFGRIKMGVWSFRLGRFWTWNVGLGLATGDRAEEGGRLLRDPAAKLSVALSVALVAGHGVLLSSMMH